MKRTTLTAALFTIFFLSCTTYSVEKVAKGFVPKKDGIFYYLPKVEYEIAIEYEETKIKISKLVNTKSLPIDTLKKAIQDKLEGMQPEIYDKDTVLYSVKNVTFSPIVIPDTSQFYYISLLRKGHPFLKKSFAAALTTDGFITGMTMESEDNTLGFGVGMVETAASIYGSVMGFGTKAKETAGAPQGGAKNETKLDTVIARLNLIRKIMREMATGNAFVGEYTDKPVEFMYQKLKEEEEALLALLIGTRKVTTKTQTKKYIPSEKDTTVAFEGLGEIKITLVPVQKLTDLEGLVAEKDSVNGKKGLHYRMPVTAEITVTLLANNSASEIAKGGSDGGAPTVPVVKVAAIKPETPMDKQIHRKNYLIPQLGPTTYLPVRIGLTKNKLEFAIDPATGALLSFSANSEGASLETIAKLNGAITGTVSGAVDKREADKEKEKNKVKVEQENTINYLENQIKLKQLQLQLDSLNNSLR